MSCKGVPIPPAADEVGLRRMVFCEDFENDRAVDFSGDGREGFNFYINRNRWRAAISQSDAEIRGSVLHLRPSPSMGAGGISTYSHVSNRGFTMHFGYVEARIRVSRPLGRHRQWPKFWAAPLYDDNPGEYVHRAELVVMELVDPLDKGRSRGRGKDMIYAGVLHDLWYDETDGKPRRRLCSNSVNATGYNDNFCYVDTEWHTYGALWEPGHVSWYFDNELMHSVRFVGGALPQYYSGDDPRPLPRIEEIYPHSTFDVWEGAHTVTDRETMALAISCHCYWTMDVDWVRVWQN